MKSDPKKRTVTVGLFIFLGLLFLSAGILAVGNLHSTFVKKMQISAVFDDVNGLQTGNNVWFSGVKIGTVSRLSFSGQSQVQVLIKIDEKAQQYIHKDSKVKISSDGLIGNKIIVIYGGTTQSPLVEDGDLLGIEAQVSTEEMMGTLQDNNRNLLAITTDFKAISKKIAAGEGSIGKMLNDETLYKSLDVTLASLQRSSAHAEKLTASIADYGNKLNREGSLANDLVSDTLIYHNLLTSVENLEKLTNTAADATANLKTATQNVSKATSSLDNRNSPLGVMLYDEKTAGHLKATIQNLEGGTQKLDEDLRALQDNFLLRKYFKKKNKAQKEATQDSIKAAVKN